MVTPFAATLPVGSSHTPEPVAPVRSQAQHDAVAVIVGSDEFDTSCSNPFVPEVGNYTGPFTFTWYDVSGKLHAVKIGKTGRILREAVAD
jgi:hypothetical protein